MGFLKFAKQVKSQQGLTLIELLLVLAIIGIVYSLTFSQNTSSTENAVRQAASATLGNIASSLKLHILAEGGTTACLGPIGGISRRTAGGVGARNLPAYTAGFANGGTAYTGTLCGPAGGQSCARYNFRSNPTTGINTNCAAAGPGVNYSQSTLANVPVGRIIAGGTQFVAVARTNIPGAGDGIAVNEIDNMVDCTAANCGSINP